MALDRWACANPSRYLYHIWLHSLVYDGQLPCSFHAEEPNLAKYFSKITFNSRYHSCTSYSFRNRKK